MENVLPFPAPGQNIEAVADQAIQALILEFSGWPLRAVIAGAAAASRAAVRGAGVQKATAAGRHEVLRRGIGGAA